MPRSPIPRRRVAGVSLLALAVAAVVLFAMRRIPPHSPGGGKSGVGVVDADAEKSSGSHRFRAHIRRDGAPGAGIPEAPADLDAEAARVSNLPEGEARLEALVRLMEWWAAADPDKAAAWAGRLPAGTFRTDAVSELAQHWAARDPNAAAAWLISSGLADSETSGRLAAGRAAVSPTEAAQWALTLTDAEQRRSAVNAIAATWALKEPAVAATWIESLPADEKFAAAAQIVGPWAEMDAPAASTWLLRLSPDHTDDIAVAAAVLVNRWTEADPGAVSRWVNSLPAGDTREAAAAVFAVAAAPIAPADAMQWAQSLTDETRRIETVTGVCESWHDAAPDEFRAAIGTHLQKMTDPAMRKSVYEMLYEKDEDFHDNLLELIENQPDDSAQPNGDTPGP